MIAGLLFAADAALAQTQTPPCRAPAAAQLDFWVGDWEVRWTNDGKEAHGRNRITKTLGGCVILEEFDGGDGTPPRGTSVSLFDTAAGKWKQVWVDNQGSWLDFEGTTVDGDFSFARNVVTPEGPRRQRMVFRDVKPDSLTWNWEVSNDDGKTWALRWRILYARRK